MIMAISLQKFREIVFQLLYSHDFSKADKEDMLPFMMREFLVPRKKIGEAQAIKEKVHARLEEIDQLIRNSSQNYAFERITRVELNILRLAIYELLTDSVPPKVAISEAVRLARKYGGSEGGAFVNAVVDKIYQEKKNAAVEVPAGEIA